MTLKHPSLRFTSLAASAFAFALVLFLPGRASASGMAESVIINRIKEKSLHFGHALDEAVSIKGYPTGSAQSALIELESWVADNQYPHIVEFLNSLDADSAGVLFDAFLTDNKYLSNEDLPIFEDNFFRGQASALSLPFRGEASVLAPDTAASNTWLFAPSATKYLTSKPAAENQFKALAPAPGWVASSPTAADNLSEGCPGAGLVSVNHGAGEASVFTCITPSPELRDRAVRGEVTGVPVLTPRGFLFRYLFAKSAGAPPEGAVARFALYFARAEGQGAYRLVLSGHPAPGEILIDHETYMKLSGN